MLQTWRNALIRPGKKVFEYEKTNPNATSGTAQNWIIIASAIFAVLLWTNGMYTLYRWLEPSPELKAEYSSVLDLIEIMMGVSSLMLIIIIPVMFMIFTGFRHMLARILKGQGRFGTYAYLCAAVEAPVMVISGLLFFIPSIWRSMSFLLMLYMYIQLYYATKVTYNLSWDKTTAVVLIPPLLFIIFVRIASRIVITNFLLTLLPG